MGYVSNKLIEVTEQVLNHLPSEILDTETEDFELFDDIQEFILQNGILEDSPASIASEFTKHFYSAKSS